MTSTFQNTFQTRAISALERAFGNSATLTQGAGTSEAFTATWNDTEYEVIDDEGFATKVAARDFYFNVADVEIAAATVTPRAGDRITITENGVAKQFQLTQVGKRPAAELLHSGLRWLVHTKQVT